MRPHHLLVPVAALLLALPDGGTLAAESPHGELLPGRSRVAVHTPPGNLKARARAAEEVYRRLGGFLFERSAPPISTRSNSCASCHDDPVPLDGVVQRYPRYDEESSRFITLEEQIMTCVTQRMSGLRARIGRRQRVALQIYLKSRGRED